MRKCGLAVAALAVLVSAAEWLAGMSLCGGELCYPLDDTYIHLAMARQLAESGTWGLEAGVPVFASSSPLWTVLLAAAVKVCGVREWLPLAFSFLFAFLSVLVAFRFWERAAVPRWFALLSGVFLVAAVPFVTLSNLGMEHAMHVFLVEMVLYAAWRHLAAARSSRADVAILLALCALATAARYESLFVVAPVAALLVLRRKPAVGVGMVAAAFAPVVGFGLYAVACGRPFLPVSLLLKAQVGPEAVVRGICGLYCGIAPEVIHVYLAVGLLLVVAAMPKTDKSLSALSLALAVSIVGHGVFAHFGWLYRYEAYLVCACFTLLPAAVAKFVPDRLVHGAAGPADGDSAGVLIRKIAVLMLCLGVAFPFAARGFKANYDTVLAQREIFGQQMQMARIVASLPAELKGPVAVSDLGCMAMFSGVHVLDIWGLGSPDVAEIVRSRKVPQDGFAGLFARHRVRYVAIYDGWYDLKRLSPDIRVVAKLSMSGPRVICAGDTVLLGVTDAADAAPFAACLRDYAPRLPPGVTLSLSMAIPDR